jgi:aspartate/methionine/tyrosine aminotransferase
MLGEAELKALAHYCTARGIRLISDEIYHGISYGMKGVSALHFNDDAVIVNSFSKYFSMTGWRIGWMVVPPPLIRSIECLAQNLFISPPTLSQLAAEAAFDCTEELDQNVQRYARNRDLLLSALPAAGFDRLAPADGAFYIYADIAHLTNDSEAFCRRMLNETGIAMTPGTDFDPARGRAYMRVSYSGGTDDIIDAMKRLKEWMPSGA